MVQKGTITTLPLQKICSDVNNKKWNKNNKEGDKKNHKEDKSGVTHRPRYSRLLPLSSSRAGTQVQNNRLFKGRVQGRNGVRWKGEGVRHNETRVDNASWIKLFTRDDTNKHVLAPVRQKSKSQPTR